MCAGHPAGAIAYARPEPCTNVLEAESEPSGGSVMPRPSATGPPAVIPGTMTRARPASPARSSPSPPRPEPASARSGHDWSHRDRRVATGRRDPKGTRPSSPPARLQRSPTPARHDHGVHADDRRDDVLVRARADRRRGRIVAVDYEGDRQGPGASSPRRGAAIVRHRIERGSAGARPRAHVRSWLIASGTNVNQAGWARRRGSRRASAGPGEWPAVLRVIVALGPPPPTLPRAAS